jgi:carboxymethylenebutenolidase
MARSNVDLRTTDGTMNCRTFAPDGEGPWPGAIFFMDGLGIRPALEQMAERLASSGYYVLLPNLFYRSGPFVPFDAVEVFKGGPELDRLMALIRTASSDRMMRDTAACLEYLDGQPAVRGKDIGVTGYCMGGRAAMLAAATFPDRIAAAGIFHAGGLATDQPQSPHLLANKIRAKLYIGIAAIDHGFSDQERERLREALEQAGVQFTMEVYPDVGHGFCVPGLPVYNESASERHWRELLRLLAEALPADARNAAVV